MHKQSEYIMSSVRFLNIQEDHMNHMKLFRRSFFEFGLTYYTPELDVSRLFLLWMVEEYVEKGSRRRHAYLYPYF